MSGYLYRSSGYNSEKLFDIVIVTEQGITEGGLSKGAVIPIGHYYVPEWNKELNALAREHFLNRYVAKHCGDENVLTHITPTGFVNRFGIYHTRTPMPEGDWCIDVKKSSWFRRKAIHNINELLQYM